MCGIFGAMLTGTPHPLQRTLLYATLATEMDSRGKDSWGCLRLKPDNKFTVYKQLGLAGRASSVYQFCEENFLLAHTRFGTVGAKDDKNNAHPFIYRSKKNGHRIIGVHNGSVSNHSQLDSKYGVRFNVDSEHIFFSLMKDENMKGLEGYGVACWYDTRTPGRIYLCKLTGGGDLAIAQLKEKAGLVWASTAHAVNEAIKRADLAIDGSMYEIKPKKIYAIDRNNHQLLDPALPDVEFDSGVRQFRGHYGADSYSYTPSTFSLLEWDHEVGVPIKFANHTNLEYDKCACYRWKHQVLSDHIKQVSKYITPLFEGKDAVTFKDAKHVSTSYGSCSPVGGCQNKPAHFAFVWAELNKMGKLSKDGTTLPFPEAPATGNTSGSSDGATARPTPPAGSTVIPPGWVHTEVDGVRMLVRRQTMLELVKTDSKDSSSASATASTSDTRSRVYAPFNDEDARQFFDVALFKWSHNRLPNSIEEMNYFIDMVEPATREHFRVAKWEPTKLKERQATDVVDKLMAEERAKVQSSVNNLVEELAKKGVAQAKEKVEPEWQEKETINFTN